MISSDPRVDPSTLGASIYCDRQLHRLAREVLYPLRSELRAGNPTTGVIWFMRYSRGGQHIKLRILTDGEAFWPEIKARVTGLTESFFATLPEPEEERISSPKLPPIDIEDNIDGAHPDRSILWVRFRPSVLTLGNENYLTDERLLQLFYRCMSTNSGLVLEETLKSGEELSLKERQSFLLQVVVAGLFALDMLPEQWLTYLEYHRDWLLRYLLSQSPPKTTAAETIDRLDQKLKGMESTLSALSSIIADQTRRRDKSHNDQYSELRGALRGYFVHVCGFRGNSEYDLDPYTSDAAFLPLFKVLHGFANPINVPILNELYTYQLLLRAAERADSTGGVAPAAV